MHTKAHQVPYTYIVAHVIYSNISLQTYDLSKTVGLALNEKKNDYQEDAW